MRIRYGAAPNLPPIVTGLSKPSGALGDFGHGDLVGYISVSVALCIRLLSVANQIHIWTCLYGDTTYKQCFSDGPLQTFALWIGLRMCRKFNALRSVIFGRVLSGRNDMGKEMESGVSRTK